MDPISPACLIQDGWKVWHAPDFDPQFVLERLSTPEPGVQAQFEEFDGQGGYWKGGPLRIKSGLRYQAKQRLLGLPHPRLAEFNNLLWLRKRLFCAPRPLAVGELRRGGLVRYQWLFTGTLLGRRTWSEAWPDLDPQARTRCILHLADEVARMHGLHFVHRDLFPRNLMIDVDPAAEQPVGFLDAWAGGPGMGLRGPNYDIACLALDWPGHWSAEEQTLFLERYLDRRKAHGKPIRGVLAWIRSVERQREAWVKKLQASSRRRGGRPVPTAGWKAPIRG